MAVEDLCILFCDVYQIQLSVKFIEITPKKLTGWKCY